MNWPINFRRRGVSPSPPLRGGEPPPGPNPPTSNSLASRTPPSTITLPNELWLQIMRHVPKGQLYQLIGVNSFFLDVGMNAKWKEVAVEVYVDAECIADAVHLLKRMRDPFVGKRIKTVLICLKNFANSRGNKRSNNEHAAAASTRINKLVSQYLRNKSNNATTTTTANTNHTATFNDAASSLISTLPHLSGVSELEVELFQVPSGIATPLFQSIAQSFSKSLDRLVLGGHLDAYRVLVEACGPLPSFEKLTTLHVELVSRLQGPSRSAVAVAAAADGNDDDNDNNNASSSSDRALLANSIAPFVKRLSPTLETLRVWSWSAIDFSGFYDVLAKADFPTLKRLYVRMAFDDQALTTTTTATTGQLALRSSSLKAFLLRCGPKVEDLELRLNVAGVQLDPSAEEPLGTWLVDFAHGGGGEENLPSTAVVTRTMTTTMKAVVTTFSRLTKLDIYPSITQAGMQALLFIVTSASMLLDLTIRDRYFPPAQARIVIDTVAGRRLKRLRMNVVYLDVELLDLIAQKLPCLEKIWLSVSEVLGSHEHKFHELLGLRQYDSWPVSDISIWQGGQEMERGTMMALAKAIPSVTSFFGTGSLHKFEYERVRNGPRSKLGGATTA